MTASPSITTFGELKKAGYTYQTIREELRKNLIQRFQKGQKTFEGIIGYEDSVIPDLERAILSGHHINLLGLRGQAKTRIARQMIDLLDEWIPAVSGSDLNDDPFAPVSGTARQLIEELGDNTPIHWIHRSERYGEKLATPDVTIADLIGDIDPIKAANLKLSYSDDRVIHYGIIPRSNRGIFVINEIPDLQARIQVALFNILQEGDIQIRGFKMRLPLDIQFVFTANPEDYTNRGSIVTPLKDRIGSQIITHYPKSRETALAITRQEVLNKDARKERIHLPSLAEHLLEQISIEARRSEYVDAKSGVSARLSISAMENLLSAAERRMLLNRENNTTIRVGDFIGVVPAITGKVELVYEGEQEGAGIVARNLLGKAIRTLFSEEFPNPEKLKKKGANNPFAEIENWFGEYGEMDLLHLASEKEYRTSLRAVKDLEKMAKNHRLGQMEADRWFLMEFILHGLAEFSRLNRKDLEGGNRFGDLISAYLNFGPGEDS